MNSSRFSATRTCAQPISRYPVDANFTEQERGANRRSTDTCAPIRSGWPSRGFHAAAEHRRALARLLRALELSGNGESARTLLKFGGARMELEATIPTVSPATCEKLARTMRDKGYPLTDRGVKLFKMEHGFSGVVRIGPDVAQAYVRWAGGRRTRVETSSIDELTKEERYALEILRIIGRDTDELQAAFKVLGLPKFGHNDVVDMGQKHAQALLAWAKGMQWTFDDDGWKKLAKAAGERGNNHRVTTTIASFVRDTLLGNGEPDHDYTRKQFGEHIINVRTLKMLQAVQKTVARPSEGQAAPKWLV